MSTVNVMLFTKARARDPPVFLLNVYRNYSCVYQYRLKKCICFVESHVTVNVLNYTTSRTP